MKSQIAVYGAGGHGKVVAEIISASGGTVNAFIDDNPALAGKSIAGLLVLPAQEWLREHAGDEIALGIGENHAREEAARRVKQQGCKLLTPVHPSAIIARTAKIGEGATIMPATVLNPDCEISEGAIINTGAIVEHDVRVGRYAHLSPRCATGGGAEIGAYAHIGMGANVLPLKKVGANCVVGAGAVVVDDIPHGRIASGIPAKLHGSRL